jgi:hypothetical protein
MIIKSGTNFQLCIRTGIQKETQIPASRAEVTSERFFDVHIIGN